MKSDISGEVLGEKKIYSLVCIISKSSGFSGFAGIGGLLPCPALVSALVSRSFLLVFTHDFDQLAYCIGVKLLVS